MMFKYLWTTVAYVSCIHETIKKSLNSNSGLYHSIQFRIFYLPISYLRN
jgi:hypothetical protein